MLYTKGNKRPTDANRSDASEAGFSLDGVIVWIASFSFTLFNECSDPVNTKLQDFLKYVYLI